MEEQPQVPIKKVEETHITFVRNVKRKLDAVSPSFCLAKWLQVTVHLGTGKTHSCHHPRAHQVGVYEVEHDPSALHNSSVKMNIERQDMMNGVQTSSCDYCWRIENSQPDALSDRAMKSAAPWAYKHLDRVAKHGALTPIHPTYLEVSMGTTCNMRCLYCSPEFSSKWEEDVNRHGGYKVGTQELYNPIWLKANDMLQIKTENGEQNAYEKAFDKWFPDVVPHLHTLRLTGGEPLLNKSTWRVMDDLIQNPRPDLEFAINTNLCVPDKLVDQLIETLTALDGKVKTLTVFTSAEAVGKQQEFARDGMDWDRFTTNVNRIITQTKARITFMTTINVLSVPTFVDFVHWVLELRRKHEKWVEGQYGRIGLSPNYMRYPDFLSLRALNSAWRLKFNADCQMLAAEKGTEPGELFAHERKQIQQIGQWTLEGTDADSARAGFDLLMFLDQVKVRRGLDHEVVFPGLRSMLTL
jgi:organic radical activating enzyme